MAIIKVKREFYWYELIDKIKATGSSPDDLKIFQVGINSIKIPTIEFWKLFSPKI